MTKDSLLYWYPKIKDLNIPQPRTVIVPIYEREMKSIRNERVPETLTAKVHKTIQDNFELPVFIRTDLASGKHEWKKSCYYDGTGELWHNLYHIISFNLCADIFGLPFEAMVVREYIPMDTRFTAFWGEMPVNPERRYFVKDGRVQCRHAYWQKEAIADSGKRPSLVNWEEHCDEMNKETEDELRLLDWHSHKVAQELDGYWSVDFCKAKDGKWVLIDCATGENSWHPASCKYGHEPRNLLG